MVASVEHAESLEEIVAAAPGRKASLNRIAHVCFSMSGGTFFFEEPQENQDEAAAGSDGGGCAVAGISRSALEGSRMA